jgi:hypothetical protein
VIPWADTRRNNGLITTNDDLAQYVITRGAALTDNQEPTTDNHQL